LAADLWHTDNSNAEKPVKQEKKCHLPGGGAGRGDKTALEEQEGNWGEARARNPVAGQSDKMGYGAPAERIP